MSPLHYHRWAIAGLSALMLTGLQLVSIAALRPQAPATKAIPSDKSKPIRIEKAPKRAAKTAGAHQALSSSAPRLSSPIAPSLVDVPSALTARFDSHPGVGIGSRLGGYGLFSEGAPSSPKARSTRVLSRPTPRYPVGARKRNIEGFVTLRLLVDAGGRVSDAVIVESEPAGVFDAAALSAARNYRFEAAPSNGDTGTAAVEQRILFRLD